MSLAIGSAVEWVTVDRATGKPHRSTVTAIRAFEDVQSNQNGVVRCAVLDCNRLAPVSQLYPIGEAPKIMAEREASNGSSVRESSTPQQMARRQSFEGDEPQTSLAKIQSQSVPRGKAGDSERRVLTNDHERAAASNGRNLESDRLADREPQEDDRDFLRSSPKPPAGKADRPKAVETEVRGRESVGSTERRDVRAVSCNVLAIDFMNLLVRAWHVGKPTDSHAVRSLFQTTANAIRRLNPSHVVFALDGGHKRRSELLPEYKAHREPHHPNLLQQIQLGEQALKVAGFQCIRVVDWEADDVLATLADAFSDTVIVSSDKDLLVMTGRATRCRVYHPWGEGEFVTPEEKLGLAANQITDYLALCGDTADGVPGVNGIGPKTATELLKEFDSIEGILVAATTGQIKGAKGEKLKAQRAQAMLCREVIQLNWSLPLPPLESFSPVALWRQKLQDMRLQSVTAIMETLQGLRFVKPERFPLTAQHHQAATGWNDAEECLLWAAENGATVAEMQAWRRAKNGQDLWEETESTNTPPGRLPASATSAEVEPGGRDDGQNAERGVLAAAQADHLSQADGQSVAANRSQQPANSIEDSPRIADCESVGSSDATTDWLVQQHQQGQKYAEYARNGREVENPWKRDSQQWLAWEQGFRGEPFNPARATPVQESTAAGQKRGVLF